MSNVGSSAIFPNIQWTQSFCFTAAGKDLLVCKVCFAQREARISIVLFQMISDDTLIVVVPCNFDLLVSK